MMRSGGQEWYKGAGITEKAERLFDRVSVTFVVFLATGWAYAIGTARTTGDKVNLVTPATAAVVSALSERVAPTAAYVTNAVADVVENLPPSMLGESGKLRAAIQPGKRPRIVSAIVSLGQALKPIADFNLITPRPASDERHGRIGLYYLGKWPAERTEKGGRVEYAPPSGFIEVNRATADTRLSEHFTIRDFLTHNQPSVWPKYVVINLKLIDKLELVLADLQANGIDPNGVHVLSGFRTPAYNVSGGDTRGRAGMSRHMYGDAADIYIDNDRTGRMSDLNHDGRVDIDDARVILAAVDRVERSHPSLIGGCGVYEGTSAHGPFVHIDTRGYPARWVGTGDN
jgi:uncharacterized protein YcbK (DUF882 family)